MDRTETTNYATKFGDIIFAYGQYVLTCPELNLEVRGKHIEWVLTAAAEIITEVSKMKDQNELDALMFTADEAEEAGEAADVEIRQELLKFKMENRYDTVPQCGITFDGEDYRWIAQWARAETQEPFIERLFKPSMRQTRGKARIEAPNLDNLPDPPVPAGAAAGGRAK